MSKSKKIDMIKILMRAHKRGVRDAIELAVRTNTSLVVYKDGKVQEIKPELPKPSRKNSKK